MPTHLYCLLPGESDSAAPAVGEGVAVRALHVGSLVAWVVSTTADRLAREGRRAAGEAVRHDRVIAQALARGVTPVPGTLADPYPDDAALVADITSRTAEIMESFRRIAGAVEMAVILAPRESASDDPPDLSGGPGRRYLERQRDLPSRLTAAADDIDQRVGSLALATSRRTDKDRVGLSHLVRRGDVERYRSVTVGAISDRYRLVVDGPRAPYSFAAFSPRIADRG